MAVTLRAAGRPCCRLAGTAPHSATHAPDADIAAETVTLADGPRWRSARRWDVMIWLRTPPASHGHHPDGEAGADVVIDLHDPAWPVIRHVASPLAGRGPWYISETRAFFTPRAATGWLLTTYDDAVHRFLAIATRQ